MVLELGDIVEGTNKLQIDRIHGKQVLCTCLACNKQDVYDKEELESNNVVCNTCLYYNDTDSLVKGDYEECVHILNRTVKRAGTQVLTEAATKSVSKKIGQTYGDLKVISYIGIVRRNELDYVTVEPTNKVVLNCPLCKYTIIEKENKKIDYTCPNCSKIEAMRNKRIQDFNSKLKSRERVTVSNRIKKKQDEPFPKMRSPLDNIKRGSKVAKHIENIKRLNNTYTVRDLEVVGGTYTTTCSCNVCGAETVIPHTLKVKKVECVGCEKLKLNPNFIGTMQRNWIGYTKNNLVVIQQKGDTCTVACKMCRHTQEEVSVYEVIHGKIYCDCDTARNESYFDRFCESCGKPMSIKIKQLVCNSDNSNEVVCDKCGDKSGITYQELINEQIGNDEKSTICNRLNIAIKSYKDSIVTIDKLVKDNTPVYVGTDDMIYYRCRCLEHNADLILNANEIANFEHTMCEDGRQHIIQAIDVNTLKI